MTRQWVKKELKDNPLERIVTKSINYVVNNKNRIFMEAAILGVIGLFILMIVRNKINEKKGAAKIFAFAQNDFYRFNYKLSCKNNLFYTT